MKDCRKSSDQLWWSCSTHSFCHQGFPGAEGCTKTQTSTPSISNSLPPPRPVDPARRPDDSKWKLFQSAYVTSSLRHLEEDYFYNFYIVVFDGGVLKFTLSLLINIWRGPWPKRNQRLALFVPLNFLNNHSDFWQFTSNLNYKVFIFCNYCDKKNSPALPPKAQWLERPSG